MSTSHLSSSNKSAGEQDSELESREDTSTYSYKDVTARDQAYIHIGHRYYSVVDPQSHASSSAVASPAAKEESRHETEEHKRVLDSLDFKEMGSRYMNIRSNLAGTCEWLLNTSEYRQWQDASLMPQHHGFLWIKGKAGAGKSTILKYASDIATKNCAEGEHVLNFFFNARGASMETSSEGLLRTMLFQILDKIPRLYAELTKRRFDVVMRHSWSAELLRNAFRDAVMHLEQDCAICFIDAMDECRHEDVEDIVRFLDDLGDSAIAGAARFMVCLSSRHYPNLAISKSVELVLEHQEGHSKDIKDYIQRRLLVDDENLKDELARTIEKKADGVFLWVTLVVALLNADDRRGNMDEIEKHLDQVPAELHGVFDEMLARGPRNKHLRAILLWVTLSTRPLSGEELYSVLTSTTQIEPSSNDNPTGRKIEVVTDSSSKRRKTEAAFKHGSAGIKDHALPSHATIGKFILESSKGLIETVSGPERFSKPKRRVQTGLPASIRESTIKSSSRDSMKRFGTDLEGPKGAQGAQFYHDPFSTTEANFSSEDTYSSSDDMDYFGTDRDVPKGAPIAQFIHESTRTYFSKNGLRHLDTDWDMSRREVDAGGLQDLDLETTENMVARYHDQLKERCLLYLLETVWRREEMPKSLEGMSIEKIQGLQRRLWSRFPFVEYALEGLWLHAERAYIRGLPQILFLESLPLNKLGVLQQLGSQSVIFRIVSFGDAPCYTACSLVASNCPKLLEVALRKVSSSGRTHHQWCAILAFGLWRFDREIIRIILRHRMGLVRRPSPWQTLHIAFDDDRSWQRLLRQSHSLVHLSRLSASGDLDRVVQEIRKLEVEAEDIDFP